MIRIPAAILGASRATRAALLLGTLLLGAVFHFCHHLQDPGCGASFDRSGHACTVCAGLHGSTLVAAEQHAPAPRPTAWAEDAQALRADPAAAERGDASPRAPPAS